MDDYKPIIVNALETLLKKDTAEKRIFQARAYKKILDQLKTIQTPIRSLEDLVAIEGAGEKIKQKFKEILETGSLRAAETVKATFPIELYDSLQKIYGVGPVKAHSLVQNEFITSIADLRAKIATKPDLLNNIQTIGLQYYEDINERIPRAEMEQHAAILMAALPKTLEGTIVGSYRRKAVSSGDIDMLLKGSQGFKEYIQSLKASKYIVEILAEGDKKCLAICKLPGSGSKGRRLDLLVTPEAEYACAILYFTGSDLFNVAMRKWALTRGYSLNEHVLSIAGPVGSAGPVPPMKSEKDIFDFLGLVYVNPEDRKNEEQIQAKPKTIKIKKPVPKKN